MPNRSVTQWPTWRKRRSRQVARGARMHVVSALDQSSPATAVSTDTCAVVAHGIAASALAEMPLLRKQVGMSGGGLLTPAFLRHLDDQTIVGLAAVAAAIQSA